MIIEKIDRFVENMEKSREMKKFFRKGKESKLKKLSKKSIETHEVEVQKSSTIGEYHYNSYNNTITGNATTCTWTEHQTNFTTTAIIM
ncbi:MAG: hypothetical protein K2O29_06870 [Ruminococcus sp.]|nr:hypothetical protein [Ruminococcus sp.]